MTTETRVDGTTDTTDTMGMGDVDEGAQSVLWHEGKRAASEFDAIDVLAPVLEELVEVRLGDRRIVRATNFGEALPARCLGLERVGREERERMGVC